MDRLKIEGQNGKIYPTRRLEDGSWYCDCHGYNTNTKKCFHTEKAQDFADNNFKQNRFNVTSAFHKEVRRGDVQLGLNWANIMQKTQGATRVRDYCRGIVFEETRNVKLFDILHNKWKDIDRIDLAKLLITSRKRWMDTKYDCFANQVEGFLLQAGKEVYKPSGVMLVVMYAKEMKYWHGAAFSSSSQTDEFDGHTSKERSAQFWDTVAEENRKGNLKNGEWIQIILNTDARGLHERATVAELATGAWDESMNEFIESDIEYQKPDFIPKFEDYIHDCHSGIGKGRLYKSWFDLKAERAMPDKIDMRWSGMMYGLLWRFEAYRQYQTTDLRNIKWQDVKIRPELWEANKRLDAWFYKRFYGKAYKEHGRTEDAEFKLFLEDNLHSVKMTDPDKYEEKKY